tara:strand:+ start:238 stop:822 length:585 start_codon:yes stop_codon:yes gene_type:complete
MGLIEHAKLELEIAGLFSKEGDFYEGMTGESVMELIEVFSKQGHSGMSAPMVADIFKKLANYEPLQPITGKDEEWGDVRDFNDGKSWYQNKRCSALFKDGEDGRPYYIDAIIKRDQKGICWSGLAWLNEEDYKIGDRSKMIGKRGYIKSFPFTPKTFYIDVKDVEVVKDDWESFIVDPSQLDKVKEYYNLETIK